MTTTAIQWPKRAKVKRGELATTRRYDSLCGDWAVVEVDSPTLGRYWLAVRKLGAGEYIKSRHKSRNAAEKACEE
jgi:hypothetical protein